MRFLRWICGLALFAGFSLGGEQVIAQSLRTLHNFDDVNDGRYPANALVLTDGVLYGAVEAGGSADRGTVFAGKADGTDFTVLHSFTATFDPPYTNEDGAYPQAGMTLLGKTLYGTTYNGGTSVVGVVFRMNLDGTGFTNLHNFPPDYYVYPVATNSEGAYPRGRLAGSGERLYGTASRDGAWGGGTVFAINTDGMGFTNLHSLTSSEGSSVYGGVILAGDTLYGTAYDGGQFGSGSVFAVNTNGSSFRVLHHFTAAARSYPHTNSDGAYPVGGLVLWSNMVFGTTDNGGCPGSGTVFGVNTNGTGFTNLHIFTLLSEPAYGAGSNSDGAFPQAGLIVSGNTLFGTAPGGGAYGAGTIFAVKTDGTGFTTVHDFPTGTSIPVNLVSNYDGCNPCSEVLLAEHTLYGTTTGGGGMGYGTLFGFSLLPQLTITAAGDNVLLEWPTNSVGFTNEFSLQSTTNLAVTAAWTSVSPGPVVVNGRNTVTNAVSGGPRFYRLSQ